MCMNIYENSFCRSSALKGESHTRLHCPIGIHKSTATRPWLSLKEQCHIKLDWLSVKPDSVTVKKCSVICQQPQFHELVHTLFFPWFKLICPLIHGIKHFRHGIRLNGDIGTALLLTWTPLSHLYLRDVRQWAGLCQDLSLLFKV